jgi:hypothetical protein
VQECTWVSAGQGEEISFLFLILDTEKNQTLHVDPILFLHYQKLRKQYICEICKDTVYNAVSGWYCTFNQDTKHYWGPLMVAQWLRYCATNQKVAGLIPDGVTGIFY